MMGEVASSRHRILRWYVWCCQCFFWSSPIPDLLITRWVLKIADFGLGDLLDDPPEQHLLYQAPELLRCADIVFIFAKELSSSDLRNGLLRVGVKKATSTASQLFSTKFTAGLEHYLPLKETCLIFRTIDLKRSFIRDEFFW